MSELQEPNQSAEKDASQYKSEVPHVFHSTIALSVLIGAVGAIIFNFGTWTGRIWVIVLGVIITLAGAGVYLIAARRVEKKTTNWKRLLTPFLWIAVMLGIFFVTSKCAGFVFDTAYEAGRERGREAAKSTPSPSPSPTPESTPTQTVEPIAPRILADGRIVAGITPEYFEERGRSREYTTAQIQEMNDSLIGKWIMFSGLLDDAVYRPNQKDLYVSVKRESDTHAAYVTDTEQMKLVQSLRKNDPITVLCKMSRSTINTIIFWDCEVVK